MSYEFLWQGPLPLRELVQEKLFGPCDCMDCFYDLKHRGFRLHHPTPAYDADPIAAEEVEAWLKESLPFSLLWNGKGWTFRARKGGQEFEVCAETRPLVLCYAALVLLQEEEGQPDTRVT